MIRWRANWRVTQIFGQILGYGAFAVLIGYFSNLPSYRHLAEDQATVKLSLRHAGQILGECRERSVEELANMPANMRAPLVCPRERSPLLLELMLNDELRYSKTIRARGLHEDGRASIYQRLTVPAGTTAVTVRLKDHIEAEEFHFTSRGQFDLVPGSNLVIDFDEEHGRFKFLQSGIRPDPSRSEEGTALQDTLNDLEAGNGETQHEQEVDEASVRQRLATALLDQAEYPVRDEVQAYGNEGEKKYFSHGKSLAQSE